MTAEPAGGAQSRSALRTSATPRDSKGSRGAAACSSYVASTRSTQERDVTNATREAINIARYREKDETDLVWNRIRRRITRELDTQIADWREEALNKLLSTAWNKYVASLEQGKVLELEAEYERFVNRGLDDVIPGFATVIEGT